MLTEIELPTSPTIDEALSRIDRIRRDWGKQPVPKPERRTRLLKKARVRSVAASCRMSGMRFTEAEVASLLDDPGLDVLDATQVRGYAWLLERGLPESQSLLSTDDLRSLHATLMGDPRERPAPSPYRTRPYQPEAFDSAGRAMGRVFSTLPPHMIEEKCEELVTWLEFELRSGERHPIPVIAAFTLGLQAACPFEGGNGRLARALIGMLLTRAGYPNVSYASVEAFIEQRREAYYETYDVSQTQFWKSEADMTPWVEFVAEILAAHAEEAQRAITAAPDATQLPPLQQAILDTVREHGTVDAGLLIRETGANRNTLKDNLRRLVERGALQRTGKKRGTRYRLV